MAILPRHHWWLFGALLGIYFMITGIMGGAEWVIFLTGTGTAALSYILMKINPATEVIEDEEEDTQQSSKSVDGRLREVQDLLNKGAITRSEYESARKKILSEL